MSEQVNISIQRALLPYWALENVNEKTLVILDNKYETTYLNDSLEELKPKFTYSRFDFDKMELDKVVETVGLIQNLNNIDLVIIDEQSLNSTILVNPNTKPTLTIQKNQQVGYQNIINKLTNLGYRRQDIVDEVGTFVVKGEVIDVFSPLEEYPTRLNFFDDEIETIKGFRIDDQLSFFESKKVLIPDINNEDEKEIEVKGLLGNFKHTNISYFDSNDNQDIIIPRKIINIDEWETLLKSLKEDKIEVTLTSDHSSLTSFIDPKNKKAVINKYELLDSRHTPKTSKVKSSTKRKAKLDIIELRAGDAVVHEKYGIGIYQGMQVRDSFIGKKEFIVVHYRPRIKGAKNDEILLPLEQLYLLSKYHSSIPPKMSTIGSLSWANTKKSVQKAINSVARELMELYSIRANAKGYRYLDTNDFDRQLDESFDFEMTKDQVKATNEIFKDMASDKAMDRLLIGDVGFGKTEVAVRAAFKAVQSKKQVSVLVPSTVLAIQHFETFEYRLLQFGVKIGMMSSFNTKKERDQILSKLKNGDLDIVIGTHALFNPNIKFKDLGLIIVDEEQRFGVEHKDTLKAIKTNTDILSLSATPIPRTLELSLSGIRDLSIIESPPINRQPISTTISRFSKETIKEAILREKQRMGQVFYLFNNTLKMKSKLEELKQLVGDKVVIDFVHAKLTKAQIDSAFTSFYLGKTDVLLATTIIESGIDVSNANTLIVEDAHKFGLADLYQIRGRVGRSATKSYAYLFYPSSNISDNAKQRLRVMSENNTLGSGLNIAMKDLELRGAGNLIGLEQSGSINGVGFDLYMSMLSDAVEKHKHKGQLPKTNVEVDLDIGGIIRGEYISNTDLRMDVYTKINSVKNTKQLETVKEEIIDRYGKLDKGVHILLETAKLKIHALPTSITRIVQTKDVIRFHSIDPDIEILREIEAKINYRIATKILELRVLKDENPLDIINVCEKIIKSSN